MKKNYILIVSMLFVFYSKAQDIQWEIQLGGDYAEYLYDAISTPDYGLIVVGSSLSNKTGDFDYYISKLSEQGNAEWTKSFGGSGNDLLKKISRTSDGGFILAGISNSKVSREKTSPQIGMHDIWLLKMDMSGAVQWEKTLGGLADEMITTVIPSKDGGYIIAGSSASDISKSRNTTNNSNIIYKTQKNRGNMDYWVVKLNNIGELQWQQTLGGIYVDRIRAVVELPDLSLMIGGVSNSPEGYDKDQISRGLNDWWVVQLDKEGNLMSQHTYGGEGDDQLTTLVTTSDGNILIGGSFSEISGTKRASKSDFTLLKIDLDGTILWKKSYDVAPNDILTDLVQNKDGSFLISGYANEKKGKIALTKGINDYIVIKIDKDGNESWRQIVGGNQKEVLTKTIETRDGGYILMGTTMPLNGKKTNNANFYIVKLHDKDKINVVKLPLEAMPNPTESYTAVVIGQEYATATVIIVDINGRVLKRFEAKGARLIPVNLSNYPDGMYIINVKTDNGLDNSVKVLKFD